ncbi:hypothetical protein CROQUDRAFT_296674 [Cronartium quercuum f. sp. fusiforme G11]|uniref:Uncharacterized protein n=1 Tax=Cronartium quercuum f. sp. fusiforme G11 TaxID=708437 RepID=A0A9P6NC44_9BASI|nr:hypothetical protein CROQUDRAFT_296674 [Cronartium quercuum f. sp. fusiforme G11]
MTHLSDTDDVAFILRAGQILLLTFQVVFFYLFQLLPLQGLPLTFLVVKYQSFKLLPGKLIVVWFKFCFSFRKSHHLLVFIPTLNFLQRYTVKSSDFYTCEVYDCSWSMRSQTQVEVP